MTLEISKERIKYFRKKGWTYQRIADKLNCSTETIRRRLGIAKDSNKNKKILSKRTYPKMYCNKCGFLFQLHFNPIKERKKMAYVRCPKCKRFPFYERGLDIHVKKSIMEIERSNK